MNIDNRIVSRGVFKVLIAAGTLSAGMSAIGMGLRSENLPDSFEKAMDATELKAFKDTCKKIPASATALYAAVVGIAGIGLHDTRKPKN